MPKPQRKKGKFWPWVRTMIWEKAHELYQMEQAKTMDEDFKGLTATRKELREGGYFHLAKLIVLRNLRREKKGLSSIEEEETITENSILPFKNPKQQNNKCKGSGKGKCLNLEIMCSQALFRAYFEKLAGLTVMLGIIQISVHT